MKLVVLLKGKYAGVGMKRIPRVNNIADFGSHGRKFERERKTEETERNELKHEIWKGKIRKAGGN